VGLFRLWIEVCLPCMFCYPSHPSDSEISFACPGVFPRGVQEELGRIVPRSLLVRKCVRLFLSLRHGSGFHSELNSVALSLFRKLF